MSSISVEANRDPHSPIRSPALTDENMPANMPQPETAPWVHYYISTACEHALHENRPELHAECRLSCKYAPDGVESCGCPCHTGMPLEELPPPWVDQAREIAVVLLALIQEDDNFHLPRRLAERLESDQHLFWLRGEVRPRGQWQPSAPESDGGSPNADT